MCTDAPRLAPAPGLLCDRCDPTAGWRDCWARQRKVLEYVYYDKELKKAKAELERMDAQRSEDAQRSAEAAAREEEAVGQLQEAEKALKTTRTDLQRAHSEWQGHQREHKEVSSARGRLGPCTSTRQKRRGGGGGGWRRLGKLGVGVGGAREVRRA